MTKQIKKEYSFFVCEYKTTCKWKNL
jgi:hypothetical protein